MSQKAHSDWGASSAKRWMTCPGSIAMCQGRSDTPSVYAMEGTAAHRLAEECIRASLRAENYLGTKIAVTEAGVTQEFEVDDDMAEAVQVYLDVINLDRTTLGGTLHLEQQFDLSAVREGLYGTADGALVARPTLVVYDYKHGRGVPVEVTDNPQLKYYALGAIIKHGAEQFTDVEMVVVQPRCQHPQGPVRRQTIKPIELLEFRGDLIEAVERTLQADAALVPGDHCKFCRAKAICPAQVTYAQQIARIDFTNYVDGPPAPATLSTEQLAQILERADVVEDWIGAVRKHVHALLEAGTEVPGWKLVGKRANRAWRREEDAPAFLEQLGLSEEQIWEKKLISPAKAEGFFPGKAAKTALRPLWEKRSSGSTIAPEYDKRPAIAPSAQADFAGYISNDEGQE